MNRIAKFFRDYSTARFLLPVGVLAIVFGIVFLGIVNTRSAYPQTDAVVSSSELYEAAYDEGGTHHDATYRIMVRYTVDGTEYEEEFGIGEDMKVGSVVRIDYNPNDPTSISKPTGILVPIAVIAAGAAALIGGIISVLRTREKNQRLKQQEEEWANGR